MHGETTLNSSLGNNPGDLSRETALGFTCMALATVRGTGPTSGTGVRNTLWLLWVEAEWPWLSVSGWIGGGLALGREVPGPSSLAPSPPHHRAKSPLVCPCPGSQVASGQLFLLKGPPKDTSFLLETELDANLAAPNPSPLSGSQLCCS